MTRFRARNRQEALARVEATVLRGASATPTESVPASEHAAASAEVPAEVAELVDRCQRLIAKSERLVEQSNPTDAAEMRQLVERLRGAIARRSQTEMGSAVGPLEDLVFYLQDA